MVEDLLCEPHNLIGSLKEDREKLMAAININALVVRCCWKYSKGEMEGEALMEECIALKEGITNMKDNYMNLLSDRDDLLMEVEMYHFSFKRETK